MRTLSLSKLFNESDLKQLHIDVSVENKYLLNSRKIERNINVVIEDIHNSSLYCCVYLQLQDVSPRGLS